MILNLIFNLKVNVKEKLCISKYYIDICEGDIYN